MADILDNDKRAYEGLNKNHRRLISITLSSIEKNIDEIEYYLNHSPKGRMYEIVNELDNPNKDRIVKKNRSHQKMHS